MTETHIKMSLWMCRMSVNSYNFSTISGRWQQYCWGILHSFRPSPSYSLQPQWRSCQGSAAGGDHCTTLCPLSRAQSSWKWVYWPSHSPGSANEYVYVLYRCSSKYYSLYLKPCLIHIQARLADNYVECLSAVNSVEPYKGQNIIHALFTPPHHVLQARCKVFFFLLKEVSYDSLWKSWAFQPARLPHTNIPRLPLLYTIIPINKWNLFTSLTVTTSSLVWICTTSLYHNALGYMIGALRNQANECALMAVLPKVNYLNILSFAENERDCNPPPKKWSKIKSPSPHPQLFDPTHVCIHRPRQAISQPHDLYATLYDDGFHYFFKDKFLDIMSNGESYTFKMNDFTWSVHQQEVDTVVNESSSSMLQAMSMEIIGKTPPVYHYCGHFYYLGMQILPIYQWSLLTINHRFQFNKVLPFIESRLAPDVFNPLFSQMHWKRGNKLVNVTQTMEYPFYCIHRVNLEEGVIVAHLVLTWEDKEDAQELKGSGTTIDVNHLLCKYAVSAFQLQLVVGDNVKVIASIHKGTCGTIINVLVEEGYIQVITYGGENDQHASWFLLVVNSSLTKTTVAHPVLVAWNAHRPRYNISL